MRNEAKGEQRGKERDVLNHGMICIGDGVLGTLLDVHLTQLWWYHVLRGGSLVQQKSQKDLSHSFEEPFRRVCIALEDDEPICSEWKRIVLVLNVRRP